MNRAQGQDRWTEVLQIMLSKTQKQRFKELQNSAGMSQSEFGRKLLTESLEMEGQ